MMNFKKVFLKDYSTFGIGGEASLFCSCASSDDLRESFFWAKKENIPLLVIGKGSNCLFPDEGVSCLVVHNENEFFKDEGDGHFCVGSGYSFARLGLHTAKLGWSGLEFAAGIPGSVGGAVFMNAGAGEGNQVASSLRYVDYLNEQGDIERVHVQKDMFSYRYSPFQERPGIILSAGFQLVRDENSYQRQKEMIEYRKKTQPYRQRSIGCIFRNPPQYSAGKLIEEAGLKGRTIGGAEISPIHANFIVNSGEATAADVKSLIQLVKVSVFEKSSIMLESEVRIIA